MEQENKVAEDLTTEQVNLESNPTLEIDSLKKDLQEANDKYVRIYAEFENYKRRVAKEKEDIKNTTKVNMITSILDMDNDISIALKNIKDESVREGVQLIANKLENFLKGHGIESIQTNTYDEDLHEVISVIQTGESKIIDVVNKGYSLNGKPFRHPKIVLSK